MEYMQTGDHSPELCVVPFASFINNKHSAAE